MLFRVTEANKQKIVLYVVPDDPTLNPTLQVKIDGREFYVEPSWTISELVKIDRHQTGLCGFSIELAAIPYKQIQIKDVHTNLIIYTDDTVDYNFINKRVIMPKLWANDSNLTTAFINRFKYRFEFDDPRKSRETISEILVNHCESACVIGAIDTFEILHLLHSDNLLWLFLSDPVSLLHQSLKEQGLPNDPYFCSDDVLISIANPIIRRLAALGKNSPVNQDAIRRAYTVLAHADKILTTNMSLSIFQNNVKKVSTQQHRADEYFLELLAKTDASIFDLVNDLIRPDIDFIVDEISLSFS